MKFLVACLNGILLTAVGKEFFQKGIPSPGEDGFFSVLLVIIVPSLTLLYLIFSNSDTWLSLYFKRKAAEERKRIADLEE